MGEIRRRGKIWWIRYYRNGKRHEESTRKTNYDEARDILRDREGDIAKGVPVTSKAAQLRFEDGAKDIIADYTSRKLATLKHVERRLEKHLTPYFGGRRLIDITTADLRAFRKARGDAGASVAEINRELAIVRRMYSLAVKDGRLHAKPHVPIEAEHNVRRGFLDPEQFATVKKHLPKDLQALAEFAYLTGWRVWSEVCPLEWRQVDWYARVVRLDPGTTKNRNEGGRVFPFTEAIERVLTGQLRAHKALKKRGQLVPLVFHRNGTRIKWFYDAWRTACAAAGFPGRLLHDMRRSAVRNFERAGVPRSTAMAMVGHKTESIYRRYAIVDSSMLQEAADRLDRAASPQNGTTGTITGTIDLSFETRRARRPKNSRNS